MTSRTEELYIQTRNHPVCGYLIPLESVLAYPIPAFENGETLLKFIVYQRGWAPRGMLRPVLPPHARIAIEYPSGRLVEYRDLTSSNQVNPVGEFPHAAIAGLNVKDILAKQSDFYSLTESLLPLIGHNPETDDQRSTIKSYKELLNTLLEPGLLPFYRELSPAFFDWLDSVAL